jgi:hypothetical protein
MDETQRPDRQSGTSGGIKYTIKDGIVFDNKQLLADVAAMVAKQKQAIKGPVTLQGVPSTYDAR